MGDGLEEKLARSLAENKGFDPDALGTKMNMWTADGVTVMPNADFIRPIWQFYVVEARKLIKLMAELNNG